jgi:hypothetical protein
MLGPMREHCALRGWENQAHLQIYQVPMLNPMGSKATRAEIRQDQSNLNTALVSSEWNG